jgi:hypothetical protein
VKKILLIVLICFCTSGCIPLLVGAAVYGVQKGKQNKTARLKEYDTYKMDMEELNLQRELKGLKTKKIENFSEWNN